MQALLTGRNFKIVEYLAAVSMLIMNALPWGKNRKYYCIFIDILGLSFLVIFMIFWLDKDGFICSRQQLPKNCILLKKYNRKEVFINLNN